MEKGGGVLIAAGINTVRNGTVPITSERLSMGNGGQTAGEVDAQHPALAGTGRFENVRFINSVRVQPNISAKVLAKFADGSPLLLEERIGEGRVLTLAAMLDNSTNDFPLHASYVPFVVQSGLYLAGASDVLSSVVVGSPATLRHAKSETTAADMVGPGGKHELSLSDASKAMTFDLSQAGFYEVQSANGRRSLLAVHADRRESDLTTIPDETLDLWRNTGNTSSTAENASATSQPQRSSWAAYVLLFLLIASIVETFFASRYLRQEGQTA